MKSVAPFVLAVITAVFLASMLSGPVLAAKPAAKPAVKPAADRVVVMYFHRTKRCPTCLKMGGYSEEAVKKGFAGEIKDGKVEFYYIDFQDKRNAAIAKAYRVSGPALVLAKVVDNKVAQLTNLKDIWTKVGDKKAFLKYVRDNVTACGKSTPQNPAAEQKRR